MMNVDGRMEVVDAASKGGEDDQCQGFNCEDGGKFLDAEDAEWMTYLDISWNSLTGDCYSCIPENVQMGQPTSFHVSRDAETMEPVEGDKIYDCDCPEGYYLNARKTGGACVEFVDVGAECFPNYGETTSGPYFPCKPDEAMCAHGHCVNIDNVMWDCEDDSACDPDNLDNCKVIDDCNVCGGDGTSCLDCETCYVNFRDFMVDGERKGCQLKDEQELWAEFDIVWFKDQLGGCKYKMNNPKSVAMRDEATACVIDIEGSCDGDGVTPCDPKAENPCNCLGGELPSIMTKIDEYDGYFRDAIEASAGETACDGRCWDKVKKDCDRPSLCLVDKGYVEECQGAFAQGGCDIMRSSSDAQKEIDAEETAKAQAIADIKLNIARYGMAIQEVVGKLDAPAGYFAGLDMTEADAAIVIEMEEGLELNWKEAYAMYETAAKEMKTMEEELWHIKQHMKHTKVEMKHQLENLPGMQWKCFGCWAELYKGC